MGRLHFSQGVSVGFPEKVMFKQRIRESARLCGGKAFQTKEVASQCEGLKMGTSLVCYRVSKEASMGESSKG